VSARGRIQSRCTSAATREGQLAPESTPEPAVLHEVLCANYILEYSQTHKICTVVDARPRLIDASAPSREGTNWSSRT